MNKKEFPWHSNFLEDVCKVRKADAAGPPASRHETILKWGRKHGKSQVWLDGMAATEARLSSLGQSFLSLKPRQSAALSSLLGPERVSHRIFAARHRGVLDINRAVRRGIGSKDHLSRYLKQADVHGPHPTLATHKQKEWLRISGRPVEDAVCEPPKQVAFAARLVFAAPVIAPLWDRACRFPGKTGYPGEIALIDGMLLHELLLDHDRLCAWLTAMKTIRHEPLQALENLAFAKLMDQLIDRVNGLLLFAGLQGLVGRLDPQRPDHALTRLCGVFTFAEAWHMGMELFYRSAPDGILDAVLLLCPDPEDDTLSAA